jgi:TonB family protein
MSQEVHRILSARARRETRRTEAASLAAAFLVHALALAVAVILPRLQPRPEPLQFVPVQVIPAQALGVRRPAPPRRKPSEEEKPEEKPAPSEPEPEPKEEPRETAPPPKPADDVPVLPNKEETKKPEPKRSEKPTPAVETPPGVAPGETGDQLGRRGAATGSPVGTTAFGSIGVENPDFTYGYYLDRLLSLIDAQWQRPNMGEVKAVIHFQIGKDGSISDLRVVESSGYNSFDFAALRAVQSAAPFPPLPRGYKSDSLGVNLIVY